jgi:hypothetical protein
VGGIVAGYYLTAPSHTTTSSSSSSTGSTQSVSTSGTITVNFNQLIVGYKGGLYQLSVQSTAGKPIKGVVAILSTPVQAVMCSGFGGSSMGFGNCQPAGGKSYTFAPANGGSFPGNTTFSGYDSGAGPGSAIAGSTYQTIIVFTYLDGTTSNETVSTTALGG